MHEIVFAPGQLAWDEPRAAMGGSVKNVGPLRLIELSDHAADRIAQASGEREAEYWEALEKHRDTLKRRRDALAAKDAQIDLYARSAKVSWRHWELKSALNLHLEKFRLEREKAKTGAAPLPRTPFMRAPDIDEIKRKSGQEGEAALSDYLAGQLGGDWTLIAGYKNNRGEIDRILVGPEGVFTFEVKHVGGVIHCDEDRWWRDKRDSYGNLVGKDVPIADNGGRGPSRQLNEPSDSLQAFLASRGIKVRVHRAVVFTHERAFLGSLQSIAVDFVTTVGELNLDRMFARAGGALDKQFCEKIIGLIEQDHGYHAKRQAFHRHV